MIATAGGRAVAIRVDHTLESEVQALFERVDKGRGASMFSSTVSLAKIQ